MTPEHFTHWLQGVADTLDGAPTQQQWEQIKAKLGEIRQESDYKGVNPTIKASNGASDGQSLLRLWSRNESDSPLEAAIRRMPDPYPHAEEDHRD